MARRRQILVWKANGSLPYVSPSELGRAMLPGTWRWGHPSQNYYAREKQRGEPPCPVLWETPLGDFWGEPNDDVTLSDLSHLERYQRGPVALHAGDIVVDVGSHIGTFTRIALNHGARTVVAFEPDAGSNACFKKTFAAEIAAGRVILMEGALWDKTGTVEFSVASRSDAGAVAEDFDPQYAATRIEKVRAWSLDDAVKELNLPQVDFTKWAIPGGAAMALRGARGTFAGFRPRTVVVTSISPEDPVVLPPIVVQAQPNYQVFTREVEMAYFH
jgi:FkbM family methyltransferase